MDILDELTDLSGAPPHEVKAVADRAIKEIERLREALKEIASVTKIITLEKDHHVTALELLVTSHLKIAREALKETE